MSIMSFQVSNFISRSIVEPQKILLAIRDSYPFAIENCELIQSREHDVYFITGEGGSNAIFKIYSLNYMSERRIAQIAKLSSFEHDNSYILKTDTNALFINMIFVISYKLWIKLYWCSIFFNIF